MADYYEARVDISDVVRTPALLTPDPPPDDSSPAGTFPNGATGPYYKFRATDFFTAGGGGDLLLYINIECTLGLDGTDEEWLVEETHEWTNADNSLSAVFATFSSPAGSNGADFLNDATLSIAKDEANAKYILTGLMGNSELLFADVVSPGTAPGSQLAGTFLEAAAGPYMYGGNIVTGAPTQIVKTVLEVAFKNFYTEKNGLVVRGASLALGDRGTWVPSPGLPLYEPAYTPWFVAVQSPTSYLIVNPDTGAAVVAGLVSGADPATIMTVFESRYWDVEGVPPGASVAVAYAAEHGMHTAAYVVPVSPDVLVAERTHDKFQTGTTTTIHPAGTGAVKSPNIAWCMGRLYAVFENAVTVYQRISTDLAGSWSVPTTIATGTNPVHLVDPATGFSFYFYVSGGALLLKRSGDFGGTFIDASPITVLAVIEAQTVAARFALDGSLIVAYIASGAFTQIRSSDLGRSWG